VPAGVSWRIHRPRWTAVWSLTRSGGFQVRTDRLGDRLAVVERFSRVVVRPRPGGRGPSFELRDHPGVSYAALSPDGRYVATGTWRGEGVKVWAADSGRLVRELPAEQSAGVEFTPDGASLLVLESEGACRAYRVGTWEPRWERGDPNTGFTRGLRAAFHPSGRVMAHVSDRVNLRLVDLETGEEVAVLPVPESQNLSGYQFSPDGRYVVAMTVRGTAQLWDLWRLRAALREVGLDWDPPAREGDGGEDGATRLEVTGG
jgi:WD40 repeat protein